MAFRNQRSAEILIPDSFVRRRLCGRSVGNHGAAPFDEVALPVYARFITSNRPPFVA
jgi:hypothetical protein